MPRDYYAEEIEGKPSRDYYAEEIENKIPPTEGFLKKALNQGLKTAGNTLGQMIPGQDVPFHPFGTVTGQARQMKERGLEGVTSGIKNPFLRFGSQVGLDPETYIGGGKALAEKVPQEVVGGAGKFLSAVKNPSKFFGKSMTTIQKSNPTKRVDFLQVIRDSIDDTMAKKVLDKSGVLEKYGGSRLTKEGTITENLSNLTLEESQDLVNLVKSGVRQAVKEGVVKPSEIGIAKMFSRLSKAQKYAFPEFQGVKGLYRLSKGARKLSGKIAKRAALGAAIGAGGTAGAGLVKDIFFHK